MRGKIARHFDTGIELFDRCDDRPHSVCCGHDPCAAAQLDRQEDLPGQRNVFSCDPYLTEADQDAATADDSYGIQRWIIGSCKNALINNGTDPNYYADLEALEATAQVNPFLNFTFDRTNVEGICASILNVYYEYGPQLDNGVAGDNWEELYNSYMSARKDAGIEELIAEFQRQIDAYVQANNITSW